VKKWVKKEGEKFELGDILCEIGFSSISIGFESEHSGILAKVLIHDGQLVEVEEPIAVYASNNDDYQSYLEAKRIAALEAQKLAEMAEAEKEKKEQKPDKMVLMREIKHLIQGGHLKDGSGELY
jgi:pyruvate dehydrogenase E2 component (dihydrolipoamide acetyltransferase)